MREDRLRILRVSAPALAFVLTEGTYTVEDGALPRDAQIVDVQWDFASLTLQLVVRSDSFSPVLLGEPIPELMPVTVSTEVA